LKVSLDFSQYPRYILNRERVAGRNMRNDNIKRPKERMVHVRLPEELHKRLRVKAAEEDTTLQDWVAMAIENELDRQDRRKG
jgi:predicted HicB family RNase H-like nuclease